MRIISGKLKGKSIAFIRSAITRPLKDSVKENIFNIIAHSNLLNINLNKSNILDLYSGVGSFGLECLSRGADKVIFIEKDKKAAEILNINLRTLSIKEKAEVLNEKIIKFLNRKQLKKFDIFFLDPPFADNNFIEELELIKKKKIYKNNHIVIIHRENKSSDNLKKILDLIIVKKYGRSKIIFGRF
tara:strand:+ start:314 stop:871 length:558 start_codon:yes stop_codon:yes gene_type:complete